MPKAKLPRRAVTLEDLLVHEAIEDTKKIARRQKEAKTKRAGKTKIERRD